MGTVDIFRGAVIVRTPSSHFHAESIAFVENGKELTEAEQAAGLQADDMVMRCIADKVGRLAVVVTAEILDDIREGLVMIVELALQPAGIGQRVNLGDIRGLIVEEAHLLTRL